MELRAYWNIVWRYIWIIVLIVGIVAIYVGYQEYRLRKTPGALTAYRSDVTLQIGLQAPSNGTDPNISNNIIVSEALADAFAAGPILAAKEFDTAVSNQVGSDMSAIVQRYGDHPDLGDWQNAGAIAGALGAVRVHSLVTVTVVWPTAPGAWAIANAVGKISSTHICTYLEYVVSQANSCATTESNGQPGVTAQIISSASDPYTVVGNSVGKQTTYLILLFVALVVSLALAFLAAYLDDRIYSSDDAVHLLQLPLYGEVPRAPIKGGKPSEKITNANPLQSNSRVGN